MGAGNQHTEFLSQEAVTKNLGIVLARSRKRKTKDLKKRDKQRKGERLEKKGRS
jgi:hypothetical protein